VNDGEKEQSGGGFVTGLLLGALGGVIVALLASPRPGTPNHDVLLERGRAIVDAARSRLDGAITEGRAAAERQRTALEEGA
jgi:gas vesicle protein